MNVATSALADQLLDLGYDGLFLRFDTNALDELVATPAQRGALEQLSLDDAAPAAARFLAAEILLHHQPDYPPEAAKAALAPVYATALASATAVNGNSWGLPGTVDGPVGAHLLRLGPAAVDALAPLLTDATRVFYEGSEEAEIGNEYQYRVKDVAAFLICQLLGWPYTVHTAPAQRDEEIAQVAARLTKRAAR
jgi:hypothetical protein